MSRYEEIAGDLRTRIRAEEYPVGSNLPGYAALTTQYGVGRGVISSAIDVLESEGLVRSRKKAGIRVLNWKIERRRIPRTQVVRRDPARGYVFPAAARADEPWETHGRPTRSHEPCPERVAVQFGLEAGISVLRRRRVTSPAGEPPFQVVDTWISPTAVRDAPQVSDANTGPGGYLDRLEEAGHGPLSWQEHTRCRMPSAEEASLLEISDRSPVLDLMLIGTSATSSQPVEVTVRVIPSDRCELVSVLTRDDSAQWPTAPVQR